MPLPTYCNGCNKIVFDSQLNPIKELLYPCQIGAGSLHTSGYSMCKPCEITLENKLWSKKITEAQRTGALVCNRCSENFVTKFGPRKGAKCLFPVQMKAWKIIAGGYDVCKQCTLELEEELAVTVHADLCCPVCNKNCITADGLPDADVLTKAQVKAQKITVNGYTSCAACYNDPKNW